MMASKFTLIISFTLISFFSFSQTELVLVDAVEIKVTYSGGTNASVSTVTVPNGHIYKLTSAGCGPNQNLNAINTDRNFSCDLHIDGNVVYRSSQNVSIPFPIWLKEGSHSIQLFVNAQTNTFNGFVYGLDFIKQ